MVIIEGCDASGKSTLILQLTRDLKIAHARSFGKPRNQDDIINWHRWTERCPQPLVLDRHPGISDLIYGNVIRGYSPSTQKLAENCRRGHFLVYCNPPPEMIRRTINNEPQMDGVTDHLLELVIQYHHVMFTLSPDFIYDYTQTGSYQHLKERVNDYIKSAYRNLPAPRTVGSQVSPD